MPDSEDPGLPRGQDIKGFRLNRVLAAAAGMSIVILALTYFLFLRNPEVAKKIPVRPESRQETLGKLAQVEEPPAYMSSDAVDDKANDALEKFQTGMQHYSDGEYQAAVPLLEEAGALDPSHAPTSFYLGISLLVTGQPDQAIAQLSRLTMPESNPYAHESHWYSAKAFLMKRDLESARKTLEIVIASGGVHSHEARKLLQKLDALR